MSTKISELPVAQEIIWLNVSDVADTGFARRGAGLVGVTKGGADDGGLLQFQVSGGHQFRLGAFASGWGLTLTDGGAGIVTFGGPNHSILVKYDSADGLIGWSASVAAKGDVAIGRAAASLLKVTDGTTGGGGIEFMRPWAERTYGIPPEQAVTLLGGIDRLTELVDASEPLGPG